MEKVVQSWTTFKGKLLLLDDLVAVRADPSDKGNGGWSSNLEPKNPKIGGSSGRARASAEAFYIFTVSRRGFKEGSRSEEE